MPPQGDLILNMEAGIEVQEMYNREIRQTFIVIDRAVTMQDNLNMMPKVVQSTMRSMLRDFLRVNPPTFLGSKVN